ncbi:MAG: hypothetical protein Q7T88_05880 [Methylotenera sp.]|nr:hypothetical protein [Methylotenera sp.]
MIDILETDQGKDAAGATGGIQGWKGTLFGPLMLQAINGVSLNLPHFNTLKAINGVSLD